jgi:hypothetical protein
MGPVSPNVTNPQDSMVPTPAGFIQQPMGHVAPTLATAIGPDGQQLGPTALMAPTPGHPAPGTPVVHQGGGVPAVANPNARTVWIFVNRNPFPVHLPHPDDPGSTVVFPPCADRNRHLGMLDFKTHPFFGNFVGFKRSITQEPAPAYLQLRPVDIEGAESAGQSVYDIMRMPPERIAEYVKWVSQSNPEIAKQIADSLGAAAPVPAGRVPNPVGPISQAPPGA